LEEVFFKCFSYPVLWTHTPEVNAANDDHILWQALDFDSVPAIMIHSTGSRSAQYKGLPLLNGIFKSISVFVEDHTNKTKRKIFTSHLQK
jgi:hypothetical protein